MVNLIGKRSNAIVRSGGSVVGTVYHPLSTTDLSSFLLQAQASKAKVIGFANAGADLLNSIKQAKDFNITADQTIVPLVGTITEINALGASATQGMILVEPFYWDLDDLSRSGADASSPSSARCRTSCRPAPIRRCRII